MIITDDLNIAGRLKVQKYTHDDQFIEEFTVKNDITLKGRDLVARLFNKDVAADKTKRVSRICLGRSKDPFDPAQEQLKDKVWETPVTDVKAVQVTDPAGKPRMMLRLTGQLAENDCNFELREAGLFTEDGVMYNRVTFDTITKSTQFKLTLVWEITF